LHSPHRHTRPKVPPGSPSDQARDLPQGAIWDQLLARFSPRRRGQSTIINRLTRPRVPESGPPRRALDHLRTQIKDLRNVLHPPGEALIRTYVNPVRFRAEIGRP